MRPLSFTNAWQKAERAFAIPNSSLSKMTRSKRISHVYFRATYQDGVLEATVLVSGFDIRYPPARQLTEANSQIQNSTRSLYLLVVLILNIRQKRKLKWDGVVRISDSEPLLRRPSDPGDGKAFRVGVEQALCRRHKYLFVLKDECRFTAGGRAQANLKGALTMRFMMLMIPKGYETAPAAPCLRPRRSPR